ncbi:hypothetical protein LTR53_009672 [Teratosphaeriaceae sp. CCFEE 6253]|nr:hypothetical protein LTR53_009672 [Teratosphaeriaceae sp. CCFEE 6253]
MAPRTRKLAPVKAKAISETVPSANKHSLPACDSNPPKLFVFHKDASPMSHIVTLPHPATTKPTRYLVDPKRGFYEFTRVSAGKTGKAGGRSVLLAAEGRDDAGETGEHVEIDFEGQDGYILESADLFVATPIDALFLLLPCLDKENHYCTFYDMLFLNSDGAYDHLRSILRSREWKFLESLMEERLRDACRVLNLRTETAYQLDVDLLAGVVFKKAEKMVAAGLPASMESHFVTRALEVPELSVKREDSAFSIVEDSTTTTASENARTMQQSGAEHLKHLLRLRTALAYLSTAYVPSRLVRAVREALVSPTRNIPYPDFTPLDACLSHIARLRAEAHALRSIGDSISRKRGIADDDEEAMERAETKKRKKEAEEAKKKNMSQGVKKLMKVDTKGMKTMGSFFTKKP